MAVSREYETLYIIVPEMGEDEQKSLIDTLNEVVTRGGGEILKSDVWGKRKLAYTIKKKSEGVYVLLRFKGGPNLFRDVDIFIKRTPAILRHLTTVVTKQQFNEEARQRELMAKRAEDARKAAEDAAKREAEAAEDAAKREAEGAAEEAAKREAEEASTEGGEVEEISGHLDEAPAAEEGAGEGVAEEEALASE
jgi:small subunit ribosomal protein S6